jgi:hypothetical protein
VLGRDLAKARIARLGEVGLHLQPNDRRRERDEEGRTARGRVRFKHNKEEEG